MPTLIPRPRSRSKEESETLPIDLGKFENGNDKNEASTRKYFVSVVYDCTKTMKKSESNGNQKIMRLFEWKIECNTTTDYKPKKIAHTFKGRYVECKSEKEKKLSMKG